MSAKRGPDDFDDEDEDDEPDFIPGADDEDDEDVLDDDWEAEDVGFPPPAGSIPPYIEGGLSIQNGCFQYAGDAGLRLVSQDDIPENVTLQSAAMKSIRVAGKLAETGDTGLYSIEITKLEKPVDELDQKLLDAQEKKNAPPVKKAAAKVDADEEDTKKPPPTASLKPPPPSSLKDPPSGDGIKKASSSQVGDVFVLNASQVINKSESSQVTFRGLFRSTNASSTHLICSVRKDATTPKGATAASPVAAAAAKKRTRGEDDDSDAGDEGVNLQEVQDPYEDAGLTPEELRQRYYGGGAAAATTGEDKKPAAEASTDAKRPKPTIIADDDDDDDDDDYGF